MSCVTISYGESLDPVSSSEGKFRIAYLENDPYFNYAGTFYGILNGLKESGWIESLEGLPYQLGDDDTKSMYEWLSTKMESKYLEFLENGYFQLIGMDDGAQDEFVRVLNETDTYDLLLVMGTKAGKFASKEIVNTPVMVMSTSNAVGAGIIASVEDSGRDNLWAHVDLDRYLRQLSVFDDVFKLKKLGIVYENTDSGRILAAVDLVESFAEERDIEIVRRFVDEAKGDDDKERYDLEVMKAYDELAHQVDGFYLTPGSRNTEELYKYLRPFYDAKVPVFSQVGPLEVSKGALMSVYRFNYDEIGFFGSDRLIRILKGTVPRELAQNFGETPSIFLNLAVAERIEYKIPFDILLISDRIFTVIEGEEVK